MLHEQEVRASRGYFEPEKQFLGMVYTQRNAKTPDATRYAKEKVISIT